MMGNTLDPVHQYYHECRGYLNQLQKGLDSVEKRSDVMKLAQESLHHFVQELQQHPNQMNSEVVSELSHLMHDFYALQGDEKLKRAAVKAVKLTLSFFGDGYRDVDKIFKALYEVVKFDVDEEIVGQERNPGVLIKQIEIELKHPLNTREKILAVNLNPMALFAATFEPAARVPDEAQEQALLIEDTEMFYRESLAQFKDVIRDGWKPDDFTACLQNVWKLRRNL